MLLSLFSVLKAKEAFEIAVIYACSSLPASEPVDLCPRNLVRINVGGHSDAELVNFWYPVIIWWTRGLEIGRATLVQPVLYNLNCVW